MEPDSVTEGNEARAEKPKRDPDKVRDTLSRIRNRKALTEKSGEASADEAGEGSTAQPLSSVGLNERRKILLKQRQQSRSNADESTEEDQGNKRSSGRQGPRSPLKNQRSSVRRSKLGQFENDDDDEEDEDGEEDNVDEKEKEEEDEEVEILDIVHVEAAVQMFPMTILPKWRQEENQITSSVLIPAPHPDLGPYCRVAGGCLTSGVSTLCTCVGCVSEQQHQRRSAQPVPLSKNKQHDESDFVQQTHNSNVNSADYSSGGGCFHAGSTDELDLSRWIAQQRVSDDQLRAMNKELAATNKRNDRSGQNGALRDGARDSTRLSSGNEYEDSLGADELTGLLTCDDTQQNFPLYTRNGLYASSSPMLARILLRGEAVHQSIASLTAPDLNMSRVTQRTLRELRNSIAEEGIRRQWAMINEPRSTTAQEADGDETPEVVASQKETSSHSSSFSPGLPAQLNLLRQLDTAPMLQLVENPLDSNCSQPVVPPVSVTYGGQLGQWGDEASVADRTGELPAGWRDQGGKRGAASAQQRAILRVHVHQLILSDHAMMSAEERRLVDLKVSYAQYKALFEQRTLEFLMARLTHLIDQLAEVSREETSKGSRERDEEELLYVRRLYHDLVDTLPALSELSRAVDSLTLSIYEGWREIVEIRRRYGVTNTTANLVVRKIRSNLQQSTTDRRAGQQRLSTTHEEQGEEETEIPNEEEDEQAWSRLRRSLQTVPDLLRMVQQIIHKDDLLPVDRSVDGPRSLAASPSTVSIQNNHADEKTERQTKLQAKLDKVLAVVGEATSDLLTTSGLMPLFALRLSEDGAVTPDNQLSVVEMKRRAYLSSCKFKIVVRVNGQAITSTEYSVLKVSSLSADYRKYFEFRLLHQPYDITLDVYSSKVALLDPTETLVASVSVPIPGLSHSDVRSAALTAARKKGGGRQNVTHSFAPITGWYSFAAALPASAFTGSGGGGFSLSELLSGGYTNRDEVASNAEFHTMRRTEGAILCTSEYDVSATDHPTHYEGLRSEEAALIPHSRSSSDGVLTRRNRNGIVTSATGGGDSKVSDFTRENDFQHMLPEYADLDANDPQNDHLLYLKSKRSVAGDEDVFRLSGLDIGVPYQCDNVSYSNYVKLKECNRMKLLRLRTLKPYLFSDPIPLSETVIKNSELYKKIFSAESDLASSTQQEEEDSSAQLVGGKESVHTGKVTNFLMRVRNSQTALHRNKRKKKLATSSVVIETNYLEMEEVQLGALLERKRSLRPKVKARAAVSIQIDSCELLVQIVGAKNIPLRSEFEYSDVSAANKKMAAGSQSTKKPRRPRAEGGAGSESEGEGASDADNLILRRSRAGSEAEQPIVSEHMLDERKLKERRRAKTFVEVRFQENIIATTSYDGGTPMWKQSVSLPFRPPQDDFSPSNLDQLREDIHFTLFDEVEEDDADRGGFLEGESTARIEKRYLGSCSVPFTTLFHEGRIEGVFRMDTPTINFGYDHTSSFATRRAVDDGTMFVQDVDPDGPPSARGGAADPNVSNIEVTGIFSGVLWLFDCLLRTANSRAMVAKKTLSDSLFYNGSYIHKETQSELAYFAADDKSTYIKLLMTFDPVLVTAPSVEDDISVTTVIRDDRYLVHYTRMWMDSIRAIGPHTKDRPYKLFGTNSSGLNALVCRYLTPQKPPAGFESRRAVLHLASMMPFMKDAQSFIGELDLWCTTKQFWEIGAGDEEEHATLVYNYLYYLSVASGENKAALAEKDHHKGRKQQQSDYPSEEAVRGECVFLVLGRAIPEGDTVYILLRDARRKGVAGSPENFLVINPCSGYVYSALDPNCPLREIHCLATPYNVWGNIQTACRPSEMLYDVLDIDQWRPFFGQRLKPPVGGLSTIQDEIEYAESSPSYALEVEKGIYTALRNSIRRWRSKRHRSTTTFHPDACSVMHELLPSLETWKRSGGLADSDAPRVNTIERVGSKNKGDDFNSALERLQGEARDRMKTLLRTRTLKGCPINLPFTDVDEIVSKIKTLCIHEAQHPEVQFVMAVRAFPIYNNVLSIWIFLGTLESNA